MIYAHAILFSKAGDDTDFWGSLNAVILDKWPTGLDRVKKMAFDLAKARTRINELMGATIDRGSAEVT